MRSAQFVRYNVYELEDLRVMAIESDDFEYARIILDEIDSRMRGRRATASVTRNGMAVSL